MSLNDPGPDDLIPEWHAYANCLDIPTETANRLFFPERGATTDLAKAICNECVVKQTCLDYAISNHERFGVWGGASPRERRRIASVRMQKRRL